jgi:hypothetical protein
MNEDYAPEQLAEAARALTPEYLAQVQAARPDLAKKCPICHRAICVCEDLPSRPCGEPLVARR